eukprot:1818238-Amphidinium_carterae.1
MASLQEELTAVRDELYAERAARSASAQETAALRNEVDGHRDANSSVSQESPIVLPSLSSIPPHPKFQESTPPSRYDIDYHIVDSPLLMQWRLPDISSRQSLTVRQALGLSLIRHQLPDASESDARCYMNRGWEKDVALESDHH